MILEIDVLDLDKNTTNYLDDIILSKLDGLIIRNVLDVNTISMINDNIKSTNQHIYIKQFGNVLGDVLHNAKDHVTYFKHSNEFNDMLNSIFGQNFISWYESFLIQLNPSKKTELAKIDNIKMLSANIKIMDKAYKSLEPHTELSLYNEVPMLDIVKKNFDTEEILSFFLQLNTPKLGGELILYNFRYSQNYLNSLPIHHKLINMYLRVIKSKKIHIQSGDAILFNAGRIWHSINKIKSDDSRITLQNFISMSKTKDKYLNWT